MRPDHNFTPDGEAPKPVTCPLSLRGKIARELDQLREDMEEIGVQLCLDEEVMLRCMSHLQRLDEMGQRSIWLAALVRAENPCDVIPDITLKSLADRLRD
ncbi:MAG: hypothetical protein AB7U35_14425 [Sphingobium sp.]